MLLPFEGKVVFAVLDADRTELLFKIVEELSRNKERKIKETLDY